MWARLWLLLGLWTLVSLGQVGRWESDLALWTQAQAAAPSSPRPALNLATAWWRAGRPDLAAIWARRAAELAEAPVRAPARAAIRRAVASHLAAAGVCADPAFRQWCSPG